MFKRIPSYFFTSELISYKCEKDIGEIESLQSHRVLSKATRAPPPHCSEIRFPDLRSSSSPGSGIATSSVIQFRRKRNSIVRCSVTPSARNRIIMATVW
ncbi:hypothetical protein P8452_53832 [Trifolium repens]|nr:hypothetical protein P8452_53832 [Trifolium repens]